MASSPAPPRVKKRTSSLNTVTNILTEYYFIFLHVALLLCCSLRLRASCERTEFASLIFQFWRVTAREACHGLVGRCEGSELQLQV
jgi:hypothetical protein